MSLLSVSRRTVGQASSLPDPSAPCPSSTYKLQLAMSYSSGPHSAERRQRSEANTICPPAQYVGSKSFQYGWSVSCFRPLPSTLISNRCSGGWRLRSSNAPLPSAAADVVSDAPG